MCVRPHLAPLHREVGIYQVRRKHKQEAPFGLAPNCLLRPYLQSTGHDALCVRRAFPRLGPPHRRAQGPSRVRGVDALQSLRRAKAGQQHQVQKDPERERFRPSVSEDRLYRFHGKDLPSRLRVSGHGFYLRRLESVALRSRIGSWAAGLFLGPQRLSKNSKLKIHLLLTINMKFSSSIIFSRSGINSWDKAIVPHYATFYKP